MTVAILAMCTLMVPLGAILSLQIGSSASPVSGTVFVTTVVLCPVALYSTTPALELVPLLTALLVGACVAVCTANDASQDYRTLQLCGIPSREAFGAQYWGLLAGCVFVPVSMYVAHEAYGLGTNALVAPQAGLFASVVDTLLLQTGDVPW
ncbi:MAG: OPT/YSL family transporter [Acidobacteriota bacterium]|nr:OPT/YSL family transporter [Acidobacteriota bacterium]